MDGSLEILSNLLGVSLIGSKVADFDTGRKEEGMGVDFRYYVLCFVGKFRSLYMVVIRFCVFFFVELE